MISKYRCLVILFLGIFCSLFFITKATATTCFEPKEECIEGKGEVRNIENFLIDPGCWKKKVIYECRENADNNCQLLRDQKCSQIGAKCKVMFNSTCVVQDEVYNCPIKKCELKELPCAKDIFCIDGSCTSTNPTKANEKDLGKALAHLAALNEAAKQVEDQNTRDPIIFTGKVMECARYMLPGLTKDCCNDNEGMFSCDKEEKELSIMKKAGRVIEVGRYCHNKDPITKTCTSRHTAYCTFNSRIARIIQNDGRRKQLGIDFGYVNDNDKASQVNCRGITKDELTKMKFDLMDFSELYEEMKKGAEAKAPKKEALKQRTSEYSHDDLKSRSTKNLGIQESPETGIGLKAAERVREFYEKQAKK